MKCRSLAILNKLRYIWLIQLLFLFIIVPVSEYVIMRGPDKHIFVQLIVLFVLSFLTSGGGESRNLACEMLIAIDEPLYRTIYKENVTKTTEMAEDYIRRINKIYQK